MARDPALLGPCWGRAGLLIERRNSSTASRPVAVAMVQMTLWRTKEQ